MSELITFHEHSVEKPEGLVFFSPPYLMVRKQYEAIFAVLGDLRFDVIECERNDVEMTRDTNGMKAVAALMTDKIATLDGRRVIDVGMSLGSGFTGLARQNSKTKPASSLILSPAPDPVTPWDNDAFLPFLNAENDGQEFIGGQGNYDVLKQIKAANEVMEELGKIIVIAEKSRGINSREAIGDWAKKIKAEIYFCVYVHGNFHGRREVGELTRASLESLKCEL